MVSALSLLIVAASAQDFMEGLDIIPDGWGAVNISNPHGRALYPSLGCQRCCSSNPSERDCSQGYNGMAGVCCAGSGSGFIGCCPLRSSCVQCRSSWRCTNSMSVSLASRCSICGAANDKPDACRFVGGMQFGGHYSGSHSSPIVSMIILGLLIVSCAACFYTQQQGAYVVGQPGVVVQGQPGVVMQGGYPGGYYGGGYGGGAGVAGGAAAGFVGGMLVGEMMDSGGGYGGGGYGGGYGGGDFGGGGGDAGFAADG